MLLPLLAAGIAASAAHGACSLAKLPDLPVTMHGTRAVVPAKVNGVDGQFLVDTGAFFSSMSPGFAARNNVRLGPGSWIEGAGRGDVRYSVASAQEFDFDGLPFHHIDFVVLETESGEGWDGSIGENILRAPDVEYDFANGAIRLFKPTGCGSADLAYWTSSQSDSVVQIDGSTPLQLDAVAASINGVPIRVAFDTGAYRSILSLAAAARAGVKPTDPGVVSTGYTAGVGRRSQFRIWRGKFASFKLGGEEIKNTPLLFGDLDLPGIDMLIGADFFLSHRVLISNSQRRIYFTYNGGPVFNLDNEPGRLEPAQPTKVTAPPAADRPADASDYARRAAAFSARGDFADAIGYLTEAMTLEPSDADYVYERARAELANHQPLLAKADLDQALKLQPEHVHALLARAEAYWAVHQQDEARADLASAVRLADKDPDKRLSIAGAYADMHLYIDAIPQLDSWIASNEKDERLALAYNERCRARAKLGIELDKALADCNAALRLLPGDPDMLDSRGLVLLRRGELDKAITDYDAALRLRPEAWSFYGRGLAKLRKGIAAEGNADIAAATAVDPRVPEEARLAGLAP